MKEYGMRKILISKFRETEVGMTDPVWCRHDVPFPLEILMPITAKMRRTIKFRGIESTHQR
jgi:hypothetical protein